MQPSNSLDALRRALDAPDGFDRSRHRDRTEGLRTSFPHTVRYHELVDGSTCLTYALGLFRDRTYLAIAGSCFNYQIFAGKRFVQWLMEKGHLKEVARPAPGCLVFYFAGEVWQHAGTGVSNERVLSQWGTFPVYEHEAFEIPARYGNQVRYFAMPGSERIRDLFVVFAKHHYGITEEEIAEAIQYEG